MSAINSVLQSSGILFFLVVAQERAVEEGRRERELANIYDYVEKLR
jgi:hypothetical protein